MKNIFEFKGFNIKINVDSAGVDNLIMLQDMFVKKAYSKDDLIGLEKAIIDGGIKLKLSEDCIFEEWIELSKEQQIEDAKKLALGFGSIIKSIIPNSFDEDRVSKERMESAFKELQEIGVISGNKSFDETNYWGGLSSKYIKEGIQLANHFEFYPLWIRKSKLGVYFVFRSEEESK